MSPATLETTNLPMPPLYFLFAQHLLPYDLPGNYPKEHSFFLPFCFSLVVYPVPRTVTGVTRCSIHLSEWMDVFFPVCLPLGSVRSLCLDIDLKKIWVKRLWSVRLDNLWLWMRGCPGQWREPWTGTWGGLCTKDRRAQLLPGTHFMGMLGGW